MPSKISPTSNSVLQDTLSVVKTVGELLQNVPYVQGIAGLVTKIIETREQIQQNTERCHELIDKVLRRSKVVLEGLRDVTISSGIDALQRLEERLRAYENFLRETLSTLERFKKKKTIAKVLSRTTDTGDLDRLDQLLDDYNTEFVTALVIGIGGKSFMAPSPTTLDVQYRPLLPAAPRLLIGRTQELNHISSMLVNCAASRIAILGGPGMGKTALASAVLHLPLVKERFSARYFVNCEGISTCSAFIMELANVLRIPPERRSDHLIDVVLSTLHRHTSLLCLDNLEAIWEESSSRSNVEILLSHLNSIDSLTLIVTMRGTQRPSRVLWTHPLLPTLTSLTEEDSEQLLVAIHPSLDDLTKKLLREAGGIPLAIDLVASLLRDGSETPQSLWDRWQRQQTSTFETGGTDRHSNLDASIRLSLNCSRMQSDKNAMDILAMLSLLPDGFPSNALQMLASEQLDRSILTLKRVALVHIDDTTNLPRIRLLSPVRHHCRENLSCPPPLRSAVTNFYTELIVTHHREQSADHPIVVPEMLNILSILNQAFVPDDPVTTPQTIDAAIAYTYWALWLGNPEYDLIQAATRHAVLSSTAKFAECKQCIGEIHGYKDQLDEAATSFNEAIQLYRSVGNHLVKEAQTLCQLGVVYRRSMKLREAEECFRKAIQLNQQTGSVGDEGSAQRELGQLFMQQGRLDEAVTAIHSAVSLHKQAQQQGREGSDLRLLAEFYLRVDKLAEAEETLKRAVEIHTEVNAALWLGNDFRYLGELYLRTDRLDEAEVVLLRARDIHVRIQDSLGEGNDWRQLGIVYERQGQFYQAEQAFQTSRKLSQTANDILGQANALHEIAELYLLQSKYTAALPFVTEAIELHEKAQHPLGLGNDFRLLGELHMSLNSFDEAETMLLKAVKAHEESRDLLGQGNDLYSLGCLQKRQQRFDEAEETLKKAVELLRKASNSLGEGNSLQALGELYNLRGMHQEAEETLLSAHHSHVLAKDKQGQANDLHLLGQHYKIRSRPDDAQRCLSEALDLATEIQISLIEANVLSDLGELWTTMERFEEAEDTLKRAVELHKATGAYLGQANSTSALGYFYARRGQYQASEATLKQAVLLFKQAQNVFGEGACLARLGVLYIDLKELEQAETVLLDALRLHEQVGLVIPQSHDCHYLSMVYMRQRKLDEAKDYLFRSLQLNHDSASLANEFHLFGGLCLGQSKWEDAAKSLELAIELHRENGDLATEGADQFLLGLAYFQQGKLGKLTEQSFLRSREINHQLGLKFEEGKALQLVGSLYLQRHDLVSAESSVLGALDLYSQCATDDATRYATTSGQLLKEIRHKLTVEWYKKKSREIIMWLISFLILVAAVYIARRHLLSERI